MLNDVAFLLRATAVHWSGGIMFFDYDGYLMLLYLFIYFYVKCAFTHLFAQRLSRASEQ